MIRFLKEERVFLLMICIWLVVGITASPLSWFVIPTSLMLLRRKKMYAEMLMGFLVILVLSDSRQYFLHFAASIKDIYLVLLFFFYLTDRQSFAPRERVFYRFLPFIVIAVLFIPLSDVMLTTLQKTISYALLFIVVPNYFTVIWKMEGDRGVRNFVWTAMLLLVAGFALRLVMPNVVTLAGRYSGVLGNPNGLGLLCLMMFILTTIMQDILPGLFSRKEQYLIWAILFASIILSGSRSAVFTITLFMTIRYFYKVAPFLGILVFLILVLVYQLILNNLEGIIIYFNLEEYFRLETFQTASGRLIAWEFGWERINENPISGNGIGYTEYYYRKNYDYLASLGHQGNAHNSYITFWIDTGIFGILAYLIAMISGFIKGASRSISAVPALLAICFSAFFESWLTASLNPFTIQFVIVLTLLLSPAFYPGIVEQIRGNNTDDLENEPTADQDEDNEILTDNVR